MSVRDRDIAIIGMSGVFPGAKDIDAFRSNLQSGVNSVLDITDERLRQTGIDQDIKYRKSGYLEGIEYFDNKLFGIANTEAAHMDPHQRIILEQAYHTIEDAGYNYEKLKGSKTAVYLSDSDHKYHLLADHFEPTLFSGNFKACMAARVSRFFDFTAAAAMIDTSCSSSLMALHLGCNDLLLNDAEYALIGGVHLTIFPYGVGDDVEIGVVSEDGIVRPFSNASNGTVFSEAAACILIKRAKDAIRDKDNIHAIIRSTAVNQDALSSASLTSPSATAQEKVLVEAWKKAEILPGELSYIETHGTGTKLGDPIEIDGITRAFEVLGKPGQPVPIGSVKSNVGHTVGVAGMTGLIKVILGLKYNEIYPTINVDELNPLIDFERSNVEVSTRHAHLDHTPGKKLFAGVSSFGMSGTNVHCVIQKWEKEEVDIEIENYFNYCISANSDDSLQELIEEFKAGANGYSSLDFQNAFFTLLAGRKQYDHRAVLNADLSIKKAIRRVSTYDKQLVIFSPYAPVKDSFLQYLSAEFPIFSETYSACMEIGGKLNNQDRLVAFSFRYALFNLLRECGLETGNLIGFGDGKLVIAAILQKQPLSDAIHALEKEEAVEGGELHKLEGFFSKTKVDSTLSFIEIGGYEAIINGMGKAVNSDTGEHCFISVTDQSAAGWYSFVGELFYNNIPVNWEKYFQLSTTGYRRKSISKYPFEKKRFWLKEPVELSRSVDLSGMLYGLNWKEKALDKSNSLTNRYPFLLIGESNDTEVLANVLKKNGCEVETLSQVTEIDAFKSKDKMHIVHLHQVLKQADARFSLEAQRISVVQQLLDVQDKIVSLSFVNLYEEEVELISKSVIGFSDSLLKSAFHEFPNTALKNIHLSNKSPVALIAEEIGHEDPSIAVLFSNGKRFVPALETVEEANDAKTPLKHEGHYIVVGGAKGIGFEVACSMTEKHKIHLTIIGRTAESAGDIQENLKKLESVAISFKYISVDIAKEGTLLDTLKKCGEERKIDGIIFSAGQSDYHLLKDTTIESLMSETASKWNGINALSEHNRVNPTIFTIVFSSVIAVTSAKGLYSYTAANSILNEAISSSASEHTNFKVINWCGWENTGILQRTENPKGKLLTKQEGIALFWKILSGDAREVFVSKEMYPHPVFYHIPSSGESRVPTDETHEVEFDTIEAKLTDEIKTILGVSTLDPSEDIIDLGLHSLNGTQLINRLKQDFGVEMDFSDLYEYSTVNKIVDFVKENAPIASTPEEKPGSSATGKYELSKSQLRVWFSEQVESSGLYNIPGEWLIKGAIDRKLCQAAFESIIDEQPALRTVIITENGVPKQEVKAQIDFEIIYHDLSDSTDIKSEIDKRVAHNKTFQFDLNQKTLLRVELARLGEDNHFMAICLHHLIGDVWSVRLIVQAFLERYHLLKGGKKLAIQFKGINYPEFAELSNTLYQTDVWKAGEEYFMGEINKCLATPLPIPYRSNDHSTFSKEADCISFTSGELSAKITDFTKKHKISSFIAVSAVIKFVLAHWTGAKLIPVVIPEAGRFTSAQENTVGYFVKELPFVSALDDNTSFEQFINNVSDNFKILMNHREYPVERLYYDALKNAGKSSDQHIYDVLVTWNQFSQIDQDLLERNNFEISYIPDEFKSSNHNIWFLINYSDDQIEINLIYRKAALEKSTALQLMDSVVLAIPLLAEDPSLTIKSLAGLPVSPGKGNKNQADARILEQLYVRVFKEEIVADSQTALFSQHMNQDELLKYTGLLEQEFSVKVSVNDLYTIVSFSNLMELIEFLQNQEELKKKNLNRKLEI